MQLHELDLVDLLGVIRRREASVAEITRHSLLRAEGVGLPLGAFACLTPDHALRQAGRADRLLATGAAEPPALLGVPCPIKALTAVAGLPWELGSAALRGQLAELTEGIAQRLEDAGTIMIGKTAAPEFGLPPYTEPAGAPPAVTPWDPTRGAGGSSGGAAVAVSAGISPIAQASDGGGSIRIPAASCGLVGLKPSRGLIGEGPHRTPGVGLGSYGVLTRTVADTATGLDAITGGWPGEWYTSTPPAEGFRARLDLPVDAPLRVGLLTDPLIVAGAPVHPEARAAALRAAGTLSRMGHEVELIPPPFAAEQWLDFFAIWAVGPLQLALRPDQEARLRPLTRWFREQGASITGVQYAQALNGLQTLARQVLTAWQHYDLVVMPTLAQPPAPVGSIRDDEDPAADFAAQCAFTPWTSVANITGQPAISLPVHRAPVDGVDLPFGAMIVADRGADELLLRIGQAIFRADPWPTRPVELSEQQLSGLRATAWPE